MKKLLLLFMSITLLSCSSDDSTPISTPEPEPTGQLKFEVQIVEGNYPQNHILIYKVVDGEEEIINLMSSNGFETIPVAFVESGDHVRVKYALGIGNNNDGADPFLTLKYMIKENNITVKSDSATISNHDAPFAEFFDITVTVD